MLPNAHARKGIYDRAIADFNQTIQLDPEYVLAYYNRGLVYRSKGDRNNAIQDFKKVLELTENIVLRHNAEQQLQKLQ